MLATLVWAVPLGLLLGTVAAVEQGRWPDRAVMALGVAGVSVPVFFVGLVLIWFVGFQWQLLPFTGRAGPLWTLAGLQSVTLPAVTLGRVFVGPVARMTRSSVLDMLRTDHVRTARAKGLTERAVVIRHALRNALIPVVTLIGLQIGFLLGGAVVTETIFSWPGVGRLAVGAILSSDFPMAQGTILVLAAGFILVNLAVDLLTPGSTRACGREAAAAGPGRRGGAGRPRVAPAAGPAGALAGPDRPVGQRPVARHGAARRRLVAGRGRPGARPGDPRAVRPAADAGDRRRLGRLGGVLGGALGLLAAFYRRAGRRDHALHGRAAVVPGDPVRAGASPPSWARACRRWCWRCRSPPSR